MRSGQGRSTTERAKGRRTKDVLVLELGADHAGWGVARAERQVRVSGRGVPVQECQSTRKRVARCHSGARGAPGGRGGRLMSERGVGAVAAKRIKRGGLARVSLRPGECVPCFLRASRPSPSPESDGRVSRSTRGGGATHTQALPPSSRSEVRRRAARPRDPRALHRARSPSSAAPKAA